MIDINIDISEWSDPFTSSLHEGSYGRGETVHGGELCSGCGNWGTEQNGCDDKLRLL